MKYDKEIKLDQFDKQIIQYISQNALLTNVELGQKLNVSANTIKNRINTMLKNKFILGFRLVINPKIIGYNSHLLFQEVNRLDFQKENKLVSYLKTIPEVTFITKHIGKWRIGIEIETQSDEEFQDIFIEIRGKFNEIITDFESFPLFKDYRINYFPDDCLE